MPIVGDHLPAGKPPRYVPSCPGQVSLLHSAEWEMSTRHSGDAVCALQGSKGRYGSCEWQVKVCDPSLTRAVPQCLIEYQVSYVSYEQILAEQMYAFCRTTGRST